MKSNISSNPLNKINTHTHNQTQEIGALDTHHKKKEKYNFNERTHEYNEIWQSKQTHFEIILNLAKSSSKFENLKGKDFFHSIDNVLSL